MTGSLERGFDVHAYNAQNMGPISDVLISAGPKIGNTSTQVPCSPGTTGFFVGEHGARQLSGNITIQMANCVFVSTSGTSTTTGPVAAGAYINTPGETFEIGNLHCENVAKCIIVGKDTASRVHIHDLDGMTNLSCTEAGQGCVAQTGAFANSAATTIYVSPNFPTGTPSTSYYEFANVRQGSAPTHTIEDNVTNETSAALVVGIYDVDISGGCATVLTSASDVPIKFCGPIQQGLNRISFSTTPTLDLAKGNIQQFACTTAHSTISPTTANLKPGMEMTFIFVQNGTTACTIACPPTMHGGTVPSTTLNSVNVQEFIVSHNGTDLYAVAAGMTGMTGGIP